MKHNIQRIVLIVALIVATAFNYSNAQSNGFEVVKNLELIDQIYEHLDKYYVDEPAPGTMSIAGINAMLNDLDPYTVFYPETDIEDYRLMTTGQYGGIGAIIKRMDDYVYIAEPYEGSPAQKAGLMAGDKILSIDGKDMKKLNTEEVSGSLKGAKGTSISVKVERSTGEIKTLNVMRDEIKLPDVPYAGMLTDKIGYVKLNSFTQTAGSDVKSAFIDLKSQGMTHFVLDLRGNGGGLLIEAVKIVNLFVKKGQTVVNTKGRVQEENRVYQTLEEPLDLEIPITVLVDGGSASASEIVAGSLQDLDRAVIVGETSYGKGLVQRTYDLKYGSKIKLTIAKYYTPSGRCVQRLEYYDRDLGMTPSEIPDSLLKIFKTKNGRDVIDGRGIEPDVAVEINDLSRMTATVYANNILFNYATQYVNAHPTIPSAREFSLTHEEYEEFKAYALKQEFTYSTASEEMLKKMRKTAEEEGYFEDSKAEYEALLEKVVPSKERDIEKFEDEIKMLLENEIVSRYYYQKGRSESAFNHDDVLDRALEILQNSTEYNTILKK